MEQVKAYPLTKPVIPLYPHIPIFPKSAEGFLLLRFQPVISYFPAPPALLHRRIIQRTIHILGRKIYDIRVKNQLLSCFCRKLPLRLRITSTCFHPALHRLRHPFLFRAGHVVFPSGFPGHPAANPKTAFLCPPLIIKQFFRSLTLFCFQPFSKRPIIHQWVCFPRMIFHIPIQI